MTEEIEREREFSLPEYINIEDLRNLTEMLRNNNMMNDSLNNKKMKFYEMIISNKPENIPNLPGFGAFVICVQGEAPGQPSSIWACVSDGTNLNETKILGLGSSSITITHVGKSFLIQQSIASKDKFYLTIIGYF